MTVSFRSFSAFRLAVFCLASLFLGTPFTDKISAQPVWSPIGNSSLISPSDVFPSFSAIGANANTIFVPKTVNNVWSLHRSLDNGTTWTTLTDPSVPVAPFSFHFNGSTTFAYQFGDGLFRSFNNGTAWSRIDFVGSAPTTRIVPLTWNDIQSPTNYDQLIQSVALLRNIGDNIEAERRVYNVLVRALNNQYSIPRFGTFKLTAFPEIIDEDYNFTLSAHSELTLDPAPELLSLVNGDKSTPPQVNNDEDAVFTVIAKAMSSSALDPIPGYGWFVSLSRSAYIDANGMTQPAQKYPVFIRHSSLYRKQTTISGSPFSCYVYPRFGDFENGSIVWNLEHFCNDSVNALQYPFLQPYQPLRTPPSPVRASGVTGVYGTAMAGDGNSLFIAVTNDHVYRTVDNGATWAKVDNNLPSFGTPPNSNLNFFIFDIDVQGSTVFVAGNRGIFRSLDNGNSWTNVKAESSTETINSIICNGTRVLAYASSGKIYRSTDNGNSWQQVTVLPTQPTTGCKLVQGDGIVFAATEHLGVYYSSDDGGTWKKIADTNPLLDAKLTAFAANSTSIFATTGLPGANNNVYRMTGYSTLPRTDISYTMSGMSGINGANLALSGTATNSTTASATGVYSFSGLANGAYTVTPTLTGYVFVPSSTSVTISGTSLSGVNFQAFTAPPPAPATVLAFSSVGASSATLTWNPPAGGAQNYVVVVRASGAPSYSPQNGTSPTGVNSNFTLASALADGSRIVYDGSGTSISLTGLSPQTSYTVVIFPSNGSGAMRSYQINAPLTGTQSTSALPQLQIVPAALDFGSVTVGTVSTGSLTISGTSLLAAVNLTAAHPALSLSLTNTPFTTQAVLSLTPTNGALGATQVFVRFSPSVIGGYASTLTASSLNATSALVTVSGAGIQSQNRYSIFGSIGIANGVLTLGGAAAQVTSASLVGDYSFSTLANGVYTVTPSLTGYVFVPSSTSVTIGGASAYGVNFQPFAAPPSASATTLVFSSVYASSATIAWNPPVGGAQSYIVVVRAGGTPSYSPANGTTPTGVNNDFTLANALADGSRVVYDGSGTSLLLTGLSPQTNYTVVVFPSNGAGALRSYQIAAPLTSSFVTLAYPRITLNPASLDFGSVTVGTVSTASFSVTGDGLTQALVLTSSGASFSLSLTGSPFTTQASLSLVPVNNTLAATTVYVRFTPGVTGASVGAILVTGASAATLSLNGTGTTPIPPPVLKAAYAGVRTPIDVTDLQVFTITFRNAANALVDYSGAGGNDVHFRGGTPLGSSTGTIALTRLSLGTYQASSVFTGIGSYTLSLVGVTSTSGTRTFTVQASVNNPVPTLSSIAPATTTATTNTWTLTLNGSNFLPESRVIVDGVPLEQQNVSFISGALLKAQVVQPLAGIYSVALENPTPGGGVSLPRTLTVNNPAPRLAAIEPTSVIAGQDAVLTLYGGYFTTATVVRFQNGTVTTTLAVLSLLSPTMATVTVPGSLITISGTYQIRAHTPVLGGGTSAAENLAVRGAAAVSSEFVNVTTSVVSGTNLNAFTVRFRDTFGNLTNVASPVLGYGENTGAAMGTIRLRYASTGVSTATATRMDIGGTYSLWINGIGTTTGSRSYTVTGGNDARVTFSGVPVSVTAGTVIPSFALRFEDAAGNLTDNGVGRLTYTRAGGGSSTATLSLTRLSLGMYTAQSTVCTIAGAYNLTVSSVTPANTFGTKAFTLTPSSFTTVDFVITTTAMTTRGGSIFVTANVYDRFGNRTDNLGDYDSLAVVVTNKEILVSTATVAFTRQSLGVYTARVPILVPGPYQSQLGGWKKGGELTNDENIFFQIIDAFLRATLDVSLSPGIAVRADFTDVPTRLFVSDMFSPPDNQAIITLRDVRGTRTSLWEGTVNFAINAVPRGMVSVTGNTLSALTVLTSANIVAHLADYGKLFLQPMEVSTLGIYSLSLNSTNGTAITTYNGNRTFTVQMPPARLTLPSLTLATLDFGEQFVLAPTTRSYTMQYAEVTTATIVIAPTNNPAFLLSGSQNGIFTTSESITLTVGGTPSVPVSGTATLWARFVPTQSGTITRTVKHTSTLSDNITTVATVQLTLKGRGLAPMVNVARTSVDMQDIPFGATRYYGYSFTYSNLTAATISLATVPTERLPAGVTFAFATTSTAVPTTATTAWTASGQTLTFSTIQPPTSATQTIEVWMRVIGGIGFGAVRVTLAHVSVGGNPRTNVADNLICVATVLPPPLTALPTGTINFGGMPIGTNATMTVSLFTGASTQPLTITVPNNLTVSFDNTNFRTGTFSILPPALGYLAMTIRCTPTTVGVINRNILIENAANSLTIRTTARGATASPTNPRGASQVVDGKYFVDNRIFFPLGWSTITGVPPALEGNDNMRLPIQAYNFYLNLRQNAFAGLNCIEDEYLGAFMSVGQTSLCLQDPACVQRYTDPTTMQFRGRTAGDGVANIDNETIQAYDNIGVMIATLREYLNILAAQNMKATIEVPVHYFGAPSNMRIQGANDASITLPREMPRDTIRRLVTALSDHPGLLGWKSVAELENHYQTVFLNFFPNPDATERRLQSVFGDFTRTNTTTPQDVANYMATTLRDLAQGNREGWFISPNDALNLYQTVKGASPNRVVEYRFQVGDLRNVHAHLLNPDVYGGVARYFDALEAETFLFHAYRNTPNGFRGDGTTPLGTIEDPSWINKPTQYNGRWYGNRDGEPTFYMNRLELGWQYTRQLLMRYTPDDGAVKLKTYTMDADLTLTSPSCGGEEREASRNEQMFTIFSSAFFLQEPEDRRVVNLAGITIWKYECSSDAVRQRQNRYLGLFDRFNVGYALLQPKINPDLVVRSVVAPALGNAASIRRIVRQYGMGGRQYYYVILINTLDNFNGQTPATDAEQQQQAYIQQNNVNIVFPELGIVRSCEELVITETGVAATPVELETITLPNAGVSQRIQGGVNFEAAGVRIYRLEINQPAVTPVMLLANNDAKQVAEISSAQPKNIPSKNNQTTEVMPDYWLHLAPNPAADATNVEFVLTHDELVTITVRDMLGRIIVQPIAQIPYSAGAHKFMLTTAALPSGMYTVTLRTSGNTQSAPLHILR